MECVSEDDSNGIDNSNSRVGCAENARGREDMSDEEG